MKRPRGKWTACALCAVVTLASCMALHAEIVEEVVRVPVQVRRSWGRQHAQDIVVTLWRDDQFPGPLPVALLGHGRSHLPDERAAVGRTHMTRAARWLAERGFLAASPIRIGYGDSGGPDLEDSGPCDRKEYPPAYAVAADQTLQVLAALRERPDVARDRAVVIGQSFGGTTAITIAARNPPGVQAVVNFAGGGGGNPVDRPQQPCAPGGLGAMFREYGSTARVPSLWVYTENDLFFGPHYPKSWFEGFQAKGGVGVFAAQPAFGTNGHALFARGMNLWGPQVEAFLRAQNALPQPAPGRTTAPVAAVSASATAPSAATVP